MARIKDSTSATRWCRGISPAGSVPVTKEVKAGATAKVPKAYLFDFFKNFKCYLENVSRAQCQGLAHAIAMYGVLLSVIAFFWLDRSFFTLENVATVYISYLAAICTVGISGLVVAVRWRLARDMVQPKNAS